jgi:PAS domain S-box-containing protein
MSPASEDGGRREVPCFDVVSPGASRAPSTPIATPEKPATPGSCSELAAQPVHVAGLLLAAFDHAPCGVALLAGDGRFLHVNPALAGILGRPTEELLRLRWRDVIHPDDLRSVETAVARALTEAEGPDAEVRALRPDGRGLWLRFTARAMPGDGHHPVRLVAHYEDVTARHAGPGWLEVVRAAVARVSDAVVATDGESRIVFLNKAAERLYRVRSAEVEGSHVADTLVHSDAPQDAREWQLCAAAGEQAREPLRAQHRRADGTTFDARVRLSAVRDGDGTQLGVTAVVRDVTGLAGHASPAALKAVVDGVAEAIIGVDRCDVVRFFSPAAERIWGRRAEEVIGRPVWRLATADRELEARELRADLRAGRSVQRETVAARKDGSQVTVQLTAIPILGRDGTYEGAALTALDVSDHRRAQRDAEHYRQLLQRVVDHAPNVIWFKDREGRCRLANRHGAVMLGLEPDDVLGCTDFDLFPRELAERNRAEDRRVLEAGRPMTFAKDLPLPDGGARTYLTTKFPIPGADGEPDGIGLVASDISAIRRGEADRARLAALVKAAPDAIVTAARDATIETWNPVAERMFGLSAEQAIGRRYDEVVVPEGERDTSRQVREQVLAGGTVTVRMEGMRSSGAVFPTQVSAAPLTAADGSHVGIVAIVRDVTDLVEAERELQEHARRLERSNADLEAFAYAASHDLQEPLRSIKMGAETVLRAAADRLHDDERGLLGYVDSAASRMSAQVYALMEVARVGLGHGSEERVPVQTPLNDALDALRAAIREAGAQIEVRGALPAAPVPRAEVTLVLQNLIANAIKFRRPDTSPHVTVSGSARDGHVEVCVADNGIGLSEADRAGIFGIFGRAHPGVAGTGMGLAVCRRIVERRGGSISASSPGPDRGSRFTVRLPVGDS